MTPVASGKKKRVFIDSNILLYAVDADGGQKREMARKLLVELVFEGQIVISTQVLQEFYNTATRKFQMDAVAVKAIVKGLGNYEVTPVSTQTIDEAIDLSILNKLSFWDSLIVVAARQSNCDIIYSEDMNSGQVVAGVKMVDPFS